MTELLPRIENPPIEVDETRQRLIDAAEPIFAEIGYEAATVRMICERAGVKNIGAVNYYFQGKEKLYTEVVKNALSCCSDGLPFPDWPTGTSAVEKLKDFVRVLMSRFVRAPRLSAMQLVTREFAQPSLATREAVMQHIHPMAHLLHEILEQLIPRVPMEKRWLIGFSVVGQCLYYRQNWAVVEILAGKEAMEKLDIDTLSGHIAGFSLAALGFGEHSSGVA